MPQTEFYDFWSASKKGGFFGEKVREIYELYEEALMRCEKVHEPSHEDTHLKYRTQVPTWPKKNEMG